MARYPGGLITANSPVTASYPSGVWTNQEAAPYQSANVWGADPNFSNTVLLLHGDGSAGSNGQLGFADSSIYNFPFTVNGDAYVSTFSPYSVPDGYWSNYFDGTGDYLSFANSTVSNTVFGNTVPMTFEFWVYPISTSWVLGSSAVNSVGNYWWELYHNSTSGLIMNFGHWGYSSASASTGGDEQVPLNQWTHVVWQRRADNTVDVYYNGVAQTVSNGFSGGYIGMQLNGVGTVNLGGGGYYTPGPVYISNFRFTKSQVYSGNFTPPTAPLSTIANTSLLTCQSNRFVDNSSTNAALTRNGDTSVQVSNPFTTSLNSNTGSGYFDGTGDKINTPSNVAFGFGTGDFTVELWIYPISVASKSIYHGTTTNSFIINVNGSNQVVVRQYGVADLFTTTGALTLTAWNHVAVSRSSTTLSVWINGSRQATGSNSTNFATTAVYIGAADTTSDSAAYISDVRTVKGTAVYSPSSSTIEIPTQPLTAIAGTSLLACQYPGTVNNGGFIDSSPYNFRIIRNGNTTQGSFTPFSKPDGRWGNYFNNAALINTQSTSGGYLSIANNTAFDIGTGDFTLEGWIYPQQLPSSDAWPSNWWQHSSLFGRGTPAQGNGYNLILGATKLIFQNNDVQIANGTHNIIANNWYHVAACRSSGTLRLFVNGTSVATSSTSFTGGAGSNFYIGAETGEGAYFVGTMTNVRLIKGAALYTSAFTPSTTPLTAISGTSLLTCQSNRFKDNSTDNFTITRNGDVAVTPFSPFPSTTAYDPAVNGGSGYFDGTGDYIQLSGGGPLILDSVNFTIEAFVYIQSGQNTQGLLNFNPHTTIGISLNRTGVGDTYVYLGNGSSWLGAPAINSNSAGNNLRFSSWNHVALVRNGATVTLYHNGVSAGSTSTVPSGMNGTLYIGSVFTTSASEFLKGYIANLRIVKGTAVYTENFTPPTAPVTAIANTSLLANFVSAGIYDNTGFNNLETVGNAQIDTSVKKYGTGAMKFDGTGDYLVSYGKEILGTSDWTIEAWVYMTSTSGIQGMFVTTNSNAQGTNDLRVGVSSGAAYLDIYAGGAGITAGTISTNTWTHLAFTRSGSSLRAFINGTQVGSTVTYTGSIQGTLWRVGSTSGSIEFFNGYIDDLRITKGIARYTANFTPPPARFPNQ